MKIALRLRKAESLAAIAAVTKARDVAATSAISERAYLASLSDAELDALIAEAEAKLNDPVKIAELSRLPPEELLAMYQQELRKSYEGEVQGR